MFLVNFHMRFLGLYIQILPLAEEATIDNLPCEIFVPPSPPPGPNTREMSGEAILDLRQQQMCATDDTPGVHQPVGNVHLCRRHSRPRTLRSAWSR